MTEEHMIGQLRGEILEAVLDTLPVEFLVIDTDDQVLAWKIKFREIPQDILGKDVKKCHPQNSLSTVARMLSEMKTGKRDYASRISRYYTDDEQHPIVIQYFALRDKHGHYLGCLACIVQPKKGV